MFSNPHLDRRLNEFEHLLELMTAELQELRWLAAGGSAERGTEKRTLKVSKPAAANCDQSNEIDSWQVRR